MENEFRTHLIAKGLAKSSVNMRIFHLRRFQAFLGRKDSVQASLADIENFIASSGAMREYRRSLISSLRTYYNFLQLAGIREDNPTTYLARIKPAEPNAKPTPELDYHRALKFADDRDWLMIQLAGVEGMRRGEVAQVHEKDLIEDLIGYSLIVHGKGSKDRTIPLKPEIAKALKKAFENSPNGYAFPGNDQGHLSPAYIGKRVSKLLPEGYSMHSLRHFAATRIHRVGKDMLLTQKFLGHASPVTTQRYVHQDPEELRSLLMAV